MSSVQRFLKQIPADKSQYAFNAAGVPNLYELVPGAGNVVGNYPGSVGYVQALNSANGTGLLIAGLGANVVVRDMGKTIRAPIASPTGAIGYFRQIQFLLPGPLTSVVGGVGAPSFGVTGGQAAASNYLTVYAPVAVGGILPLATAILANGVLSAGAM